MNGVSLDLSEIHVSFRGASALVGVDLSIGAGESVALVGPSGAGKTTLLRLLNGTLRPDRGTVRVDGTDLSTIGNRALRKVRARIGFVHQQFALVPNLRVSQNVLTGRLGSLSLLSALRTVMMPPRSELERAHAILERVGIPEKLFERTDRLSGGQQQRVAIARTLMQDPAAILADEPVSSVDPARARDTVALLTDLCREGGQTLLTSLHNIDLAREFFPRLVGLRGGRVAFDRPAREVTEEELASLYDLSAEEMLANGG